MKDLIFFFFKLPNYLRLRLILLQIAIIFTNFTEIVSIALISPYIGILANNEIIFENKILFYLYNLINFENVSSFIVFLGFVILAAIILANTFMGIVIYAGKKITNSLGNFLILKEPFPKNTNEWQNQAIQREFLLKNLLLIRESDKR